MVQRVAVMLVVAFVTASSAASAAPMQVTGPGRIAFAGGVTTAIQALSDGGTLLAGRAPGGIFVRRLRADGTFDRAAMGGVARVALPGTPEVLQLLVAPDGAIVVVAADDGGRSHLLSLLRLSAVGALDRGFGDGGIAATAVGWGYERDRPAALAADGAIVIAGSSGRSGSLRPAVAKLTRAGLPDAQFASGGLLELGGDAQRGFGGHGAVFSGGRIVVATARGLVALTPAGAPDPSFNGTGAVALAGTQQILARPDGSIDVLTVSERATRVVRLTAAGVRDTAFGAGGAITLAVHSYASPLRLLLGSDGATTLLENVLGGDPRTGGPAASIDVHRITAEGHRRPRRALHPSFGGGGAAFGVLFPLIQNAFRARDAAERPDGAFIVAGSVDVLRLSEGSSYGTTASAVAAFTPALTPDRSFGGPLAPSLTVTAGTRRAADVRARGALPLTLTTSSGGLVRLTLRDVRGHVLARRVTPIYRAGATRISLYIPPRLRGPLQGPGGTRLVLTYAFRDIVAGTVRATSSIRLR